MLRRVLKVSRNLHEQSEPFGNGTHPTLRWKWLQFSSFTLDLDRLCLLGPSGRASLRPKSFNVLRYLVAHPRRVISKDELIKACGLILPAQRLMKGRRYET